MTGPDRGGVGTRRWSSALAPFAGPALILASVAASMRVFLLHDRSTGADAVRAWLPFYCFLGRTIRAGHVPAWNPHILSGTPFAANPQSGWMYATPTALFTALPCGLA